MTKLAETESKELATTHLIQMMLKEPQVECNVVHSFGPGIYVREVRIPAGTLAVGHYHKQEHLNVFLQGKVLVLGDNDTTQVLSAPMMFNSGPGRKIGYILEDMVWLNIFSTPEKDVEKLEEMLFDKGQVWEDHIRSQKVDEARLELIRQDYQNFLAEYGISQETIDREMAEVPVVEMPDGSWPFQKGPSLIHDRGIFASNFIPAGTVIGPAYLGGQKTPLGRYVNHSPFPNSAMYRYPNGDIVLVSTLDIKGYHGGNIGDEIVVDYRQVMKMHSEGVEQCQV